MTKLNESVEQIVREALGAVVGKDSRRLQRAIFAFPDSDSMMEGIRLAAALALYVMHDLHEGRRPTDEELVEIAGDVVKAEDWTDVSADEIVKYLTAMYDKVMIDQIFSAERVIVLSYVVAGNLVSSYHQDDEEWWDYLDRAEAMIEATLEP